MLQGKVLLKSKYHWSCYLLLALVALLLYKSYLEVTTYIETLQLHQNIPLYEGLLFSLIFIPLIVYGIIFYSRAIPPVTITTTGIKLGRKFIDKNDIRDVKYLRKDFRFLIAAQTQQTVVVILKNDAKITIWIGHYINGYQMKKHIKSIIEQPHQ